MEIAWDELADSQMTQLEANGPSALLAAVRETLERLEVASFDPALKTRQFRSEGYEHVRATPIGHDDWMILWTLGDTDDWILVVAVAPLRI